ncbi:MAG: sigma-70 family RNA polymerase sigma factor [Candidatus Omnitrophota bacterium]|nr:MAG: sigma-70 family RNA polymerase sigma factor [Candidatus Omnitrophota bacterium]
MEEIRTDIIKQACRGDMRAFEEIYRIASGFVYSMALRITHNEADAEEITQDVFMKIHRNLKGFQFRSSFKTWVYRITVNTAINTYRRTAKELKRRGDYDIALKTQRAPSATEASIDRKESQRLLISLLDTLNSDQRVCILLREIEGLSYREIADVLKVKVNTVRSRIKRARQALMNHRKTGR